MDSKLSVISGQLSVKAKAKPLLAIGEPYSNFSSTGSDRNLVISFTAYNPGEFAVGDLLWWAVTDRTGQNSPSVPAFQVTAVNQSTGAVSAQSLYDGVTIPATLPGNLYLVVPTFVNGSPATGNSTSGSNQITNVTNIGNFAVGDWIQGTTWRSGDVGRITAISGTTITLSRSAWATVSGASLYNCGLVAY